MADEKKTIIPIFLQKVGLLENLSGYMMNDPWLSVKLFLEKHLNIHVNLSSYSSMIDYAELNINKREVTMSIVDELIEMI